MKVVLLGKNGLLGSEFLKLLESLDDVELVALGHADLNVADEEAVKKKISEVRPHFVINCTGYTDVDGAETEPDLAFSLNGDAVGYIAEACKMVDAILIHFSTDYVFDGKKTEGYCEDDIPAPLSVYGRSKLAGEKLLTEKWGRYYIVRTSWLYGAGGKNFVDTMRSLAEKLPEVKVVNDQFGSPTFAKDLAKMIVNEFMFGDLKGDSPLIFGICHLTNSGTCSWFDFAGKIFELTSSDVRLSPISTDQFGRPAPRPMYSILKNRYQSLQLRSWQDALREYLEV